MTKKEAAAASSIILRSRVAYRDIFLGGGESGIRTHGTL